MGASVKEFSFIFVLNKNLLKLTFFFNDLHICQLKIERFFFNNLFRVGPKCN